MTNETEPHASVTLTINLIPFGESRVDTVKVSAREIEEEPTKGLYVFPSQTARVEPSSLTNNDVQVL